MLKSERNRTQIRIVALALIFPILGTSAVEAGELPAREPLDALWEQHMLGDANTSVHIEIRGGIFHKSERAAKEPSGSWKGGRWNTIFNESRNITVAQYGEGFWGNGGWLLEGGLVGRGKEGSSTIELYGKAVEHQLPYTHFPPFITGVSRANPAGTNSTSFSVRVAAPEPPL